MVTGILLGSLGLFTKYRYVVGNGVIKILQQRFALVGWDVFIALEALGMDPYNANLVDDCVCRTNCSIGAIIQQLYTSGLSGHVHLAGDYIFLDSGFSKDVPKLRYPIKCAIAMGLCVARPGSVVSTKYTTTEAVKNDSEIEETADKPARFMSTRATKSLFDRKLKIVSEGYFGKILLVDEDDPGRFVKSASSAVTEFETQDALSMLTIMDIKPLLGNEKKLRIR